MTSADPIIAVSGLSFAIDGKAILRDIRFALTAGEYVSIIGPNGAGKSTLLRCLNRIIPDWTGSVTVAGGDLRRHSQRALARMIGYVPQLRETLFPFSVSEFALMSRYPFLSPFSPPARADHEAVDRALAQTHMTEFANRPISTLSGGECQKAFIAAALAQETPCLMLDEPVTFLDPRYQKEITDLLLRLNRDGGTTILSVTHDINSAVLSSSRILALKQGQLVFDGPPREVMAPGTLSGIFDCTFVLADHPVAHVPMVVPG